MNPPPRYPYVYLRITTEDPLSKIEAHLQRPSEGRSWSNGDQRKAPRSGKPSGHYAWSSWKLESGVESGQPLDAHLRSLWQRLEPIKEQMQSRPSHWKTCLQFVAWFDTRDTQLQFSAGHLTTAVYYGFDTDFDFYYDDDFGLDDNGPNPYWQW